MCKLDKFPSRQITRSITVVNPSILEPDIKAKPQARFLYSGKEVKITSTRKCCWRPHKEKLTTPTIRYNPESKNVQDPTELLKHSLWMFADITLLSPQGKIPCWQMIIGKTPAKDRSAKKQAHSGETLGSSTAASNLDLCLQIAGVVIKRGDHSF